MGALALWKSLPAEHRRWILLNALLVTALVNLAINALVAWISVLGQEEVPLWTRPLSETSLLGDTLGTIFMLPLITCLILTTVVRRERREGSLTPLRGEHPYLRRLAALPKSRLQRGLAFGALAFALLALPAALVLVAIDLGDLSRGEFVLFKAGFAILLGVLVTPLIALAAMAERPLPSALSQTQPGGRRA